MRMEGHEQNNPERASAQRLQMPLLLQYHLARGARDRYQREILAELKRPTVDAEKVPGFNILQF